VHSGGQPELRSRHGGRARAVRRALRPQRPVVGFDERPLQLVAETRTPLPAEPGRPRRIDYKYRCNGTCNLFTTVEPLSGWRHVEVTERRTAVDFAHHMRWLVDEAYPDVSVVRVVLDNLTCTPPRHSRWRSRPPRRVGSPGSSSSTTRPNMAVGSTWPNASWRCWPASAWANASVRSTLLATRSPLGNDAATRNDRPSNGTSPSPRPAASSATSIQTRHDRSGHPLKTV
jgi:DDE superfamily endonuclease